MLKEFWEGRYQLNIDATLKGNLLTRKCINKKGDNSEKNVTQVRLIQTYYK